MNIFPVMTILVTLIVIFLPVCIKLSGIVLKILRDMHFAPLNDLSTLHESVSHAVGCTFLAYQTYFFLVLQLQFFLSRNTIGFLLFRKSEADITNSEDIMYNFTYNDVFNLHDYTIDIL